MELRVLQYFLTVVQEENISRAAEVLRVTQPTKWPSWRRNWGCSSLCGAVT